MFLPRPQVLNHISFKGSGQKLIGFWGGNGEEKKRRLKSPIIAISSFNFPDFRSLHGIRRVAAVGLTRYPIFCFYIPLRAGGVPCPVSDNSAPALAPSSTILIKKFATCRRCPVSGVRLLGTGTGTVQHSTYFLRTNKSHHKPLSPSTHPFNRNIDHKGGGSLLLKKEKTRVKETLETFSVHLPTTYHSISYIMKKVLDK